MTLFTHGVCTQEINFENFYFILCVLLNLYTPICRCLWAETCTHTRTCTHAHTHACAHTHAPYARLFGFHGNPHGIVSPVEFFPHGNPTCWKSTHKKCHVVSMIHTTFLQLWFIKLFWRTCSQFILWQHNGWATYCTWGSGLRVVWGEVSEAHSP